MDSLAIWLGYRERLALRPVSVVAAVQKWSLMFRSRKTQKIVSTVIVALLVISMLASLVVAIVG